jgi:uncharacterized protein (TIGR00369 family)
LAATGFIVDARHALRIDPTIVWLVDRLGFYTAGAITGGTDRSGANPGRRRARRSMAEQQIRAGERFADLGSFSQRGGEGPNLWRTLGFRRTDWGPGTAVVEWDATVDYGFYTPAGPVIQGGLVTAVLDSAMGGACWTVLDNHEVFLTADLRVEFFRPTRPGTLRAAGRVVRKTSRVVFCAAELFDVDGSTLAGSRCTQVLLPAGPADV